MPIDILNIFLAFIEGLALILSPCILPILPIILSGAIDGNRSRPYGIITGFVLSFALFTLFSRNLVLWFGINLDLIRNFSLVLLIIFGLIMVSTYLTDKFNRLTQGFANLGFKATANNTQQGFGSGMVFGVLVGLIWTPCAGPILAAVIVQTLLQHSSLSSFLIIIAFAIGAGIPMLIISIFGRQIANRVDFFQRHALVIRKALGVIIILAVIFMYFSNQVYASGSITSSSKPTAKADHLISGLVNPYPAPDFQDIAAWINTQPLTMQALKGKVVLIDFWAYSCINCIRSLPYVIDWNKKYSKDGLVIVGVHSPEFDFERDLNNVQKAVKQDGILYPVALDNNFATWQAYNNHYWPAHYLIDKDGNVVYTHFGEGEYDVTENNIRYLLGIKDEMKTTTANKATQSDALTPETYLGYARSNAYSSLEPIMRDAAAEYNYPHNLFLDSWALQGKWMIQSDKIVSVQPSAAIKLHFTAKDVYAVMGNSTANPVTVTVKYHGQTVNVGAGKDVKHGAVTVTGYTLYNLLSLPFTTEGMLELIAEQPGLEIYTFTFGD